MLYGLYLSAAGLQVQERRQDMIANNLANAMTNGFKRDLAIVQSRANPMEDMPYRVPVLEDQGGGVMLGGGGLDMTQGQFEKTGKPWDFALNGSGFFALSGRNASGNSENASGNGEIVLTRDGRFVPNEQGVLVHVGSGRAVLGEDGQAVVVGPGMEAADVRLKVVDVNDPRQLIKMGKNLLTVSDASALKPAAESTQVLRGSLEMSGVNPLVELVNMMSGYRVFEANAKMISLQDMTLQALNSVGRVA